MSSGQLQRTDYFANMGGINLSDSVFRLQPSQASGGYNYDYVLTGGIRKRPGPVKLNTTPNAQLRTLGLSQYNPAAGATKVNMRAAGTKYQYFATDSNIFTDLAQDDLAADTNPFSASTQVNFAQFNSAQSNILWATGGGATLPVGAISTSQYTINGVPSPTGSISAGSPTGTAGSWTSTGTYYYSVALRKRSTQAISNAVLTTSGVVVAVTDSIPLTLSTIVVPDTTLYDKVVIYRSAVTTTTPLPDFTTGDLVAYVDTTALGSPYLDRGDLNDLEPNINVPRAGNIVEDHGQLPAGTYANVTVFKQRLVVSTGNTLYLSNIGESEYWAATDIITCPSAGPITGLAVISFTAPQANSINELLVVFKERETLVLNGDSALGAPDQFGTGWSLLSIDNATGCAGQGMIVNMQGWLAWIDYRGVHIWDGGGKPYYASRLIEPLFQYGGEIDKSKYSLGVGQFFQRENEVIWYLSSQSVGEQKYAIKMDVRLTLLQVQQQLTGGNIDAVFTRDTYALPIYGANSYIPLDGRTEQMLLGDDSGYVYYAANGQSDAGAGTAFTYLTVPLLCDDVNTTKQFHKVVAWVQATGTWDLTLQYWTNFNSTPQLASTRAVPLTTKDQGGSALWDVAVWDSSFWDTYTTTNVVPVIFNLGDASLNNTQGTAVQLQFSNLNANEPITIHGFSVFWSLQGGITA